MAVEISDELKEILADKDTVKVLASVDTEGNPHVAAKGSITLSEDNTQIIYMELLEASRTNKNLTAAIWFNNKVAINVISKDRRSYLIKGTPVKSLVAGRVYEEYYKKAQERNPENDLAAVYFINIEEVKNESYPVRLKEEQERHPLYVHLDRLAKKEA
ncbi:MAG: pyridoxamine 5'-phosphate oxidase family protein [Candidatus Ornithomonoglobus sp.]